MIEYLKPLWFDRRRCNPLTISDADLKAYDAKLIEVQRYNRNLYDKALKEHDTLLVQATKLYGKQSNAVKYIRRKRIQIPPDYRNEHTRWKNKVYRERKKADVARREALKSAEKRAKQRIYNKRYYARLKQERLEWEMALRLEGTTQRELWQMLDEELA